tara:strand:+ start:8946 stop:10289 length:1344 start_codon:yes stop_codon:yes gene_type:complete
MLRSWSLRVSVVFLAAVAGCDGTSKAIDPFPIPIDLTAGPVILRAQENDGEVLDIVVDVLSPITVLDSFCVGDEVTEPQRRRVEVTLYGANDPPIPRVRFSQTTAYDLHSCFPSEELCVAGNEETPRTVFGILGFDILTRTSVRFNFPSSELRFFPDTAGSTLERTAACDAVFDSPYGGGGTMLIAESEVRFGGWRATLGVCVHHEAIVAPDLLEVPDPEDPDADIVRVSAVGTDLQLAISTAIGPSLMTEEAYRRYSSSSEDIPEFESLEVTTLFLPSRAIQGRKAQIPFMALTGDIGADSDGRGPCRELYANARMRISRSCADNAVDCPCPDNEKSCKAAAAVELSHAIDIVIVDSGLALLQALRDELRPGVPELDGVLGVQALKTLQVEFDFPNKRLLMRCKELGTCTTRPQVTNQTTLSALDECASAEDEIRDGIDQDAGIVP